MKKSSDKADQSLSVIQHLEELRRRIIISVLAFLCGIAVCFFYAWDILEILKRPAVNAGVDLDLYYLSVLEPFMVKFKIAVYAALVIAAPVFLFEVIAFMAPGLKKNEKKVLYSSMFFVFIFFVMGLAFAYSYVLPAGITWLINQAGDQINPILSAGDYANFASLILLALGIVFQTPLVVWVIVRLGIVSPEVLMRNWRIALIVTLLAGAILTPDWNPITMFLVAAPMFILYQGSVLTASISLNRARKKKLESEERENEAA